MKKLTALILDDERRCREVLHHLLQKYCPEIDVVKLTGTIQDASDAILEYRPDILFLDVRVNRDVGFDLLTHIKAQKPLVIVTTAHKEYAIDAIRSQAFDYLLKPVIVEELRCALDKASMELAKRNEVKPAKMESLNLMITERKIGLPSSDGLVFISIKDIVWCEASGAYTKIHTKEKQFLICKNLGEFEKALTEEIGFFRVHHSSLINLTEVSLYSRNDSGYIVMSDQSRVAISKQRKGHFLDRVKSMVLSINSGLLQVS